MTKAMIEDGNRPGAEEPCELLEEVSQRAHLGREDEVFLLIHVHGFVRGFAGVLESWP
jgi:hypothetical protein